MAQIEPGMHKTGASSVRTVVQGNTGFALALYQELRAARGNLFFSPYSISTALAMTYAGAHGDTEVQMAKALHLLDQRQVHPAFAWLEAKLGEVEKKGHVQLRVANTLWPHRHYAFLKEFLALTTQYYGVLITALDYGETEAARRTINTWVEEKTDSRIKELVAPGILDPLTRLVLANAIYFKGNWASQFSPGLTRELPFWITPDDRVEVMMMTQQHTFRYAEQDGQQILELPYVGEDLSMLVLLPSQVDGLANLEGALTVENLDRWTSNLHETDVMVFLPRFEISLPTRLDKALQSMGMVDAFSGAADFSGMDGSKELFIAAILHKAFVVVNEEGTEAAAATAVMVKGRGMAPPPPVFRADHPFVLVIRENGTGSILFLGRVVNPA